MDITLLFKACVKTVKTTNKFLGRPEVKSTLLKPSPNDANLATAKDVRRQITQLQSFLLENKASYLNVLNYLSTNKTMTEVDREQIDLRAEQIIATCSTLLGEYRKELRQAFKAHRSKQREEHYANVVESLERYLKAVGKIYAETKAIRVKNVIETHKLAKFDTLREESTAIVNSTTSYDEELSGEDMQLFEQENEMLFNELNAMSEEVRQMEGKVVHIAELQELFTEKVMQQEQDIERISTNVVGATSNMKDANEQIRQAIQRNAGLRVWVLFFLLVMSFSLLFLDWYND